MSHTFKNLKVWNKAHKLVLEIYKITKTFPTSEKYGLTSQFRRSAISTSTNIVEGYKRNGVKDFLHFLNMADSSLEETKYHLILSRDLGYLKHIDYDKLSICANEVGRMLFGFQKKLKT